MGADDWDGCNSSTQEEREMRKFSMGSLIGCLVLGVATMLANTGFAADTHVIMATPQVAWNYHGQISTLRKPLMVDDLKIGDIIEIQIPQAAIPHGFITVKKDAGQPPTETKDLVVACGEDKSSKPNAVLRELDCGTQSKFGVKFTGSMRLEVLNTFKDDVYFWCVVHRAAMAGTLKLKAGS
jgi:hypothetical protein